MNITNTIGQCVSFFVYDKEQDCKRLVSGRVVEENERSIKLQGSDTWYDKYLVDEFQIANNIPKDLLGDIVAMLKKQVSKKSVREDIYASLIAIFQRHGFKRSGDPWSVM